MAIKGRIILYALGCIAVISTVVTGLPKSYSEVFQQNSGDKLVHMHYCVVMNCFKKRY